MVDGKWDILIDTPMGKRSGVLELRTSGSSLLGSLSHAEHRAEISDGKVTGNQLSWSAKITQPMRMSFKFTATVEGDRISGVAKHLLGKAAFTGTRV